MKAAGMSWVTCSLLVLAASLAAATPANDRPGNKVDVAILDVHQLTPLETFSNGFPKEFAHNLPTQEFMGDFARRHKRQAGISSAIDGILSAPYGGLPVTSHLQALLLRNTNVRPARQSAASNRPAPPLSSPSSPPSPQTFSQSSPQTFSQPSPQTFSQSSPQTLSQPSPQTFSPSNGDSPQRFQPQVVRPQRQTPRFSPAPPPPSPPRRPPPSPRRPPTPPRPSTFRVIHERPAPSPPRSSPSARESPTPSQTPFSSSSFTGHQISSTFSDFGSFFESSRLPRERRDVTEEQDASAQLSQTINSPYEDAQEAREDSPGFIAGRPDSFPRFSSVGGFGPMGDLEKGNIAGNFMEEFKIPVVRIPGIREKQPQFTPLQFLNQVSVVREDSDQPESQTPHATTSFKPFSPPSTGHEEDGFKLVFPHSAASRPDPDPVPPTPSLQPSTTNDIIPITADHRPNRPPSTPGGRAKKPTKNPFGSLLNPIRDLVRPSRQRTPSLRQVLSGAVLSPSHENLAVPFDEPQQDSTTLRIHPVCRLLDLHTLSASLY